MSGNFFIDDERTKSKHKDERNAIALERLQTYASSLPYSIEPNSKMQEFLDLYLMRIVQVRFILNMDPT
jgi:proteasome activator subunit 4